MSQIGASSSQARKDDELAVSLQRACESLFKFTPPDLNLRARGEFVTRSLVI